MSEPRSTADVATPDPDRPAPADAAPTSTRSRRGRGGAARRGAVLACQLGVAVVVLVGWEVAARLGAVDTFFFSQPTAIVARIVEWVTGGFIYPHLWITLQEAFLAFVIGTLLGVGCGFLLARVAFLAAVFDPYIKMLNALPRVVLAPIFLLWFGLGIWSKVALGVTLVFFIVFFNTYQGVREADRTMLDNARMLGASERELVRHVLLPSAMAWIFSSLHTSVGFAIVGAVVGEYLGASAGVGYVIAQAQGLFDTTGVFAGMAVLSIVVLGVEQVVDRAERYLLRWRSDPAAAPGT